MGDEAELLWARGVAGWPGLAVSRSRWDQHVAAHHPDGAPGAALHAEDLYLCVACLEGVDGAAAAFSTRFNALLHAVAREVTRDGETARDVAQELLTATLVGNGADGPLLLQYSGRGPLRAWLRMAATRRSLNAARTRARRTAVEARLIDETIAATEGPEVALIRARCGPALDGAFRAALAELSSEERALLRLVYGERVGLEAIAKMNRWSKPTASRRVAAVREAVMARTAALLSAQLALSESECGSLVGLLQSQLDVSLSGLFATGAASP